ncbi:15945_t:CDS:2 [Funneliformis geosporum]|uniref:18978_t:CDS:1 n=1 Tax=Funneliformis geosporum TaxID=1117311 RepID=A0A9W4SD88_9GLOM|nr:18978_t:CDS:2 [Funneliformis geosporum]CAI2169823.1 15945_t:CDS:2 [Funneliformis geosporum]
MNRSKSSISTEYNNLGLHSGAAAGNLGLVKFALDHGQPIDSVLNGVLPIHVACINGNVSVVQYLIERGADVNSPRLSHKYNGTEKSRTTDQTVGTTGSTALHFAAANGCTQTVELLLKKGAIVDVADKYGSTPLSVAIAKNHADVIELLKMYGAIQAAERQKCIMRDLSSSSVHNIPTTTKSSKSSKDKSSKSAKKIKKPTILFPTPKDHSPSKFNSKSHKTRRPSLPVQLTESNELNNDSTESVLLKRQASKSMELPSHLKSREEIFRDDGFMSDNLETMTIESSGKPSIDISYHSLDESSLPEVKKLRSPTKELFRKSLTLTRQLTSTSLTSLTSSKSRSPDHRFSFSSSPATPQSNPSSTSLLMTSPEIPSSPSTISTMPTEYGGDPDFISLPPAITEKKKRRSTDPLRDLKSRRWRSNEANDDDGTMTRSISEGGGMNFFFTPQTKRQQISSENFRPTESNSNSSSRKSSFSMKGLFGKLTDLVLGKYQSQ